MERETYRDRVQRQIALEAESRALGAKRYRSSRPMPWRSDPSAADEEGDEKRSAAEEEDGVKSYSIRIGGRWVQYSTLSPVAEMLGMVADMSRTFAMRQRKDG